MQTHTRRYPPVYASSHIHFQHTLDVTESKGGKIFGPTSPIFIIELKPVKDFPGEEFL